MECERLRRKGAASKGGGAVVKGKKKSGKNAATALPASSIDLPADGYSGFNATGIFFHQYLGIFRIYVC